MSAVNKYLTSDVTIFPNTPSDIQKVIILKCNPTGLIKLSGVNREASALLSNEFFKKLYDDQYPNLAVLDLLFGKLCSYHPSNCWKVVCQVMDPSWKGYQGEDKTVSIALRLSPSFVQEAKSAAVLKLESEKEKDVNRIKEICGTHFEDPHSPIDQAWKAYKKNEEEFRLVQQEFSQSQGQILIVEAPDHDKFTSILAVIEGDLDQSNVERTVERFISISYEQFVEKIDAGTKEISEEEFLVYQKIAKVTQLEQKLHAIWIRMEEFRKQYQDLEQERYQGPFHIESTDSLINDYNSNGASIHMHELTNEWNRARNIIENIESKTQLSKCNDLIMKLISTPVEQTPEAFAEIRSLINASADEYRINIWNNLYKLSGNHVTEDSWAENHFQDHLPMLGLAVEREVSYLQSHLENENRWLNSHSALL
jgi:TolA-binding protein